MKILGDDLLMVVCFVYFRSLQPKSAEPIPTENQRHDRHQQAGAGAHLMRGLRAPVAAELHHRPCGADRRGGALQCSHLLGRLCGEFFVGVEWMCDGPNLTQKYRKTSIITSKLANHMC